MRRAVLLLFAGLAGLSAAAGPVSSEGMRGTQRSLASDPFATSEGVLKFINDYRENKQPSKVPAAVHAMVRHGLLRDPEKAGIYTGFIAGVIGSNRVKATDLIAEMFPMPPVEQVVLVKAIAYSGLPDWQAFLVQFIERMPARKVLIKKYLYGGGKTLDKLELDDPYVIDVLWGFYFATGEWDPVIRIVSVLKWAEEKNDVEKLTIGAMAKWTFASNAARDKNLLDLAKSQMDHEDEAVRRQLQEVIEAAELYELSSLREAALKQIDEIKTKGPKWNRDWGTWGQAGTTALALGCVAASVLGQLQFGIPCVLGGALSTAAVNYMSKPAQ
ncbi:MULTISPECIES: hypothetical protein [Filomicrobium]|uniref:hypothetical protein n=1 Tax=Filomicrobium TaxID=119044 RepID=UPI0006964CDE|nr:MULTISPECIES: hypothetical protein [Filomicrobium]MCV0368829.1 hypothetical protein [Filomicrobium sp.]